MAVKTLQLNENPVITIAKAITLMIQLTAQKEACIHTVPSVAYNHHALLPY